MYAVRSEVDFGVLEPIPRGPYSAWNYKGLHGMTSAPCNTDATRIDAGVLRSYCTKGVDPAS